MENEDKKLNKILSKVGAAFKKTALVFNGEFSISAAFSILLFLLILPIIIVSNLEKSVYKEYEFLKDAFIYLSLSCFAGIIAATISVFFTKKKWIHAICGAAGLGIARLLIFAGEHTPGFMLEYWGFLIVLVVMFMFAVYSGEKKDEALLYVFAKFVQAMIITNFMSLGFLLCEALFFNFVVDDFNLFSDWVAPITYVFCVCIIGMCYFFANIHTDSKYNPPLSKMEKGWYHYCLLVIFSVYIFVLYAYFIKIIFSLTLPEGVIGYFVSFATAAYLFMYFSQKQFDDAWTKWFYEIGAHVMLPLIIMQCFAIYQRISAYGLTGARICNIGYVLIILVFIALILYKQGLHIRKIFPFAALVVFLLLIQPFNAQRISIIQQTAHFEQLLVKNGMLDKKLIVLTPFNFAEKTVLDEETEKDLDSICSIYSYLEERDSLPEYCRNKDFSELFGFRKNYNGKYIAPKIDPYEEYVWKKPAKNSRKTAIIDVSNYSQVLYEKTSDNYREENEITIPVYRGVNGFFWSDISNYLLENRSAIENDADSLQLKIDDNTTVEFVFIRFYYNENTKKFKDTKFEYYILMK